MAYGLEIYTPSGKLISGQTLPGGRVFVERVYKAADSSAGVQTAYTYSSVPGGDKLRVLQVGAAAHTWAVSTNGSGHAVLTLTSLAPRTPSTNPPPAGSTFLVFATDTVEPSYGLLTVNDAGERLFSSVYPCPVFLGKVTFSSTPTSSTNLSDPDGFWKYTHSITTSLGSGTNRLVLWSLPSYSTQVWFSGPSVMSSAATGLNLTVLRAPATSANTMPEAFIFQLDGLTASSDAFGLRVYNSSGALTFDAGHDHLIIKNIESSLSYPTSGENSFTMAYGSGTPAMVMPQFIREVWTNAGMTSTGLIRIGGLRRDGTTLYSRQVLMERWVVDEVISGTWSYGMSSSLTQIFVDATQITGTAF